MDVKDPNYWNEIERITGIKIDLVKRIGEYPKEDAEKIMAAIMGQVFAEARGFMKGAGIDKPEYDDLSIPQALAKRKEEISRKLHQIKVEATRTGMEAALTSELEAAARSGAAHGAKSGVAKSLPPLMRKLATAAPGDPDPLAPKTRAPGAGRPRKHDLDGKQVKDAYERIAGSPKAQSFTAICAGLIRNPPKRRKYQKPYKSAKALFNAVKRAHPDISDLRLK